ncbi:quinoprotein relay system zinc metallohydrolase 2 [Candidatus Methylopumilus turicensis]|uniref:Beta-lactamase domain protein n=1 Tax=Candidatus Methylopumilus turicensis TaxID=1581680 RepID=A0A0B7IWC4_9PROT|nr:quinoprotein relay system zinc metallohydrolase 2 [Candidatus Methylopumilus turicensis]CEN56602.1 Beta-lactamase domain protein [Candidatus Methylopumilus turicensis]
MLKRIMLAIATILSTTFALASPLTMENLGNGIYVHHGVHEDMSEGYHADICNLSFIVGSKGIAVIDTGGSLKTGQALREAIRQVSELPILYVINTHVHPDHIFGNAAFIQDKATFVGHEKLPDAMERRRENYLRINQQWLGDAFAGSEIIKPSLLVKGESKLDLGDRTLLLTAYPIAHTNTDLTVFDHKSSTLWTGDLLFVERTPSIDGDIKGWLAVINALKTNEAEFAIPGHSSSLKDANWKKQLNDQERYLWTLLNDIRASIKKGEVMEKAMGTAAASERSYWQLFDIVNRRNVNNIYPGLEWE